MKQFLRSLWTLLLLMMWCSVGFAQETLTGSWDLTKTSADWTATNYEAYFSQPYGYKKAKGTLVNKSIADFSTAGITQIKVGFKCQQTGSKGSNSKITIYLVDAKGNALGTGTEVTPKTVRSSVNTSYQYATFTSNLEEATGFMMKVTYFGKNILVNGASYEVTYNASTKTKTTLTFPETAISINGGDEASFKGQSAKLYAGEQELTDKTIEYAYTYTGDDIFATFDGTTGAATLKSGVYGTATVTATYAGDDTYEKAVATYTVKIVDPNASEVTFDFSDCTKYGYNKPTSNSKRTELEIGDVIKSSPITITVMAHGSTKNGFGTTYLGVYQEGVLKIEIEKGYVLNEVSFERNGSNNTLTINDKKAGETWTGEASFVTLSVPDGAKGTQVTSITIKYSKTAISNSLTLEEDADDTVSKIEANNGKTVDVKLTRSLKAGVWNTICLPFDVTAEQVESVLKATGYVKEFDKEDEASATIFFKPATEMKAGVPYLIKPTADALMLEFKGVTINNVDELNRINGNRYCICGVFGKTKLRTTGADLFLNAAGKFVAPAPGKETMKGFRAYFNVPSNASAAALNMNIDGETTGINNIETNAAVNGKVYNLNGQYVGNSLNGLKKGIYVVNGKKVIK